MNKYKLNQIINIIKKEIKTPANLHEPKIDKLDIKNMRKTLLKNEISSVGTFVNKFENQIKKFTKSKYVLATNTGTSAILTALIVLGIKNNDEVIMPSLNYIATANCVKLLGANLIYLDIEKSSLGLDPNKLEKFLIKNTYLKGNLCFNKKTKKVIKCLNVLHTFGYSANIFKIKKICKKYKIKILEDAAEALGSFYNKQHLGTFGDVGILSFNGNKIITAGGGGMILTNNQAIYNRSKQFINSGKKNHLWKFEYGSLGLNFKMPNLNAALGFSQLKKIRLILRKKKNLHERYLKIFKNNHELDIFTGLNGSKNNHWLNTAILKNNKISPNLFKEFFKNQIFIRPAWKLLHKIKNLKPSNYTDLKITEEIYPKIISLPSSYYL